MASISNTSATGKMSDRAEVKLTIKRSFSDDGINLLKISPFGVIPSDIHIVNKSISNQLNDKDFSSLKCVNISHTCSSS